MTDAKQSTLREIAEKFWIYRLQPAFNDDAVFRDAGCDTLRLLMEAAYDAGAASASAPTEAVKATIALAKFLDDPRNKCREKVKELL